MAFDDDLGKFGTRESSKCLICHQEIGKGQQFIFEDDFPGIADRIGSAFLRETFYSRITHQGKLYHKDCYLKTNR